MEYPSSPGPPWATVSTSSSAPSTPSSPWSAYSNAAPPSSPTSAVHTGTSNPASPYSSPGHGGGGSPSSPLYHPTCESNAYYGGDVDENVQDFKSTTDVFRERGAYVRALRLLEVAAAGEEARQTEGEIRDHQHTNMTTAKAAALKYQAYKEEQLKLKAQQKLEKHVYRPEPAFSVPVQLAETSRKKPRKEKDLETVHDYKCHLDIEREEQAKVKALRLLNYGFIN